MRSLKLLLLFFSAINIAAAEIGVCTRSEARTFVSSYYIQTSYTYSCGFWGLSRCRSYGSSVRYRSDTTYDLAYECCSGYHDPTGGINCEPICEDCDSNHICVAPYTCVCPDGWMGSDCMEDIDECIEGTSGCEQVCSNNNGSYTCSCYEKYTLSLDLHSCLGPPQNVSLNATSSMTLHLKWEEPELDSWDGTVQGYGIDCISHFGYNHQDEVEDVLEYNIYSLMPFSYYMCCVRAITTNGDSNYTCDTEQTLQDLPSDTPQNITVNNHSAFAVFIEWESPLIPNGVITLYTIYADYNNGSSEAIHLNETKRSHKLEGLSPHQLIGINMSASTIIGEGPVSTTISERTSQSVPSEVTNFEVSALSPNELLVSWNLPEYPNGILTGYKIIVYNRVYNYNSLVFVPENITHVNITDIIVQLVPYTVEISAFTQAGGGPALSYIIFSEEGVPSVTPNITVFGRTDATSLQLSWDTLSLEELRGFFHSYAVAYYELDTFQCMDIDPSTSQLTAVHKPFIVISDLVPGKEYCVGVAARTSAGVGNYTQLLIPLYTNLLFQVHFYGIHNCPEWVHQDSLDKVEEFIDQMSLELSKYCTCHIPVDNFAAERLICEQEDYSKVVFQGRLIVVEHKNTSDLQQNLKEWTATDPHIVIQGVQLEADPYCSVELTELGESECVSTTEPPPTTKPTVMTDGTPISNETDSNSSKPSPGRVTESVSVVVLGGVMAVVVFLSITIVIVAVCITRRCTKKNKRQISEPRFNVQGYCRGFDSRAVENPLYADPNLNERKEGLPAYDELEECNKEI